MISFVKQEGMAMKAPCPGGEQQECCGVKYNCSETKHSSDPKEYLCRLVIQNSSGLSLMPVTL